MFIKNPDLKDVEIRALRENLAALGESLASREAVILGIRKRNTLANKALEMERDRLARDLSSALTEIDTLRARLREIQLQPDHPEPVIQGIVPETLQELQDEWDAEKQRLGGRRPKKTKFSTKSRDTVNRYWEHIKK